MALMKLTENRFEYRTSSKEYRLSNSVSPSKLKEDLDIHYSLFSVRFSKNTSIKLEDKNAGTLASMPPQHAR